MHSCVPISLAIFLVYVTGVNIQHTEPSYSTFSLNNEVGQAFKASFPLASQFSQALANDIRKYNPDYLFLEGQVKIAVQRAAVYTGLPNPDDQNCARDYSVLCPLHWLPLEDNLSCKSPHTYSGPCEGISTFTDFSPLKKALFSLACGVEWPCDKPCREDFQKPCPVLYKLENDGTCSASSMYHGRCIRTVDLRHLSPELRILWGEQCNLRWPCVEECLQYSTRACPLYWTLSEDKTVCVAPLNYLGPCSFIQPSSLSPKRFIQDCKASYECEWITASSNDDDSNDICERDYEKHLCPEGWSFIEKAANGTVCVAGPRYKGPCAKRFSFSHYTKEMLVAFSKACKTNWPCTHDGANYNKNNISMIISVTSSPTQNKVNNKILYLNTSGPYDENIRDIYTANMSSMEAERRPSSAYSIPAQRAKRHAQLIDEFIKIGKPSLSKAPLQSLKSAKSILEHLQENVKIEYELEEPLPNITTLSAQHDLPKILEDQTPKKRVREGFRELFVAKVERINSNNRTQPEPLKQGRSLPLSRSLVRPLNSHNDENDMIRLYRQDDSAASTDAYADGVRDNKHGCIRDYSYPCPKDWHYDDTSLLCLAPDMFLRDQGMCSSAEDFISLTPYEKQRKEQECHIRWPCKLCNYDYIRSPCPQGWELLPSGDCRAAKWITRGNRSNRCPNIVNFQFMIPQLRRLWAKNCNQEWPCFQECQRDFAPSCPQGWKELNDLTESNRDKRKKNASNYKTTCVPIDSNVTGYEGVCGNKLEISPTVSARYKTEMECGVRWPCRTLCNMSFWQYCPYGYIYNKTSKSCSRPSELPAHFSFKRCETSQRFENWLSNSFKKNYVEQCHAPWPCDEQCDMDFSQPCPYKWTLNKRLPAHNWTLCTPNTSYNGPCKGLNNLTEFSQVEKWEFAWKCQVHWPCGGYLFQGRIKNPFGTRWMTLAARS